MYARNDILLLDDVFSGLDGVTEDLIFSRLFGPEGLFSRLNSTVLLVTHASKSMWNEDLVALD